MVPFIPWWRRADSLNLHSIRAAHQPLQGPCTTQKTWAWTDSFWFQLEKGEKESMQSKWASQPEQTQVEIVPIPQWALISTLRTFIQAPKWVPQQVHPKSAHKNRTCNPPHRRHKSHIHKGHCRKATESWWGHTRMVQALLSISPTPRKPLPYPAPNHTKCHNSKVAWHYPSLICKCNRSDAIKPATTQNPLNPTPGQEQLPPPSIFGRRSTPGG